MRVIAPRATVALAVAALVLFGLTDAPVTPLPVARAGLSPSLDAQRALVGETTTGGHLAVGVATVPSAVEIDGELLADGQTRRPQLVHARGFDGASWSWASADPATALPPTPLEGLWELDGMACPDDPVFGCYPGAAARVTRTSTEVQPDGRVDVLVDTEYYVSAAMHAQWGTGWHRSVGIVVSSGTHCASGGGWSSGHAVPGWYEFPVSMRCRGEVGSPPEIAFLVFRLGRPNQPDTRQSWMFPFAGLDHGAVEGSVVAEGSCMSAGGFRRSVSASTAPYAVGTGPPPSMPALSCWSHERLERFLVRRVPVAPAAFAEVTVLAWSGHTLFGETNATLTEEQVRAGAYPTGEMADPVATATGELFEHVEDLGLASYAGPVTIGRTYSSADTAGGLFGPGWRLGLETSLDGDLDGSGDGLVTHVTAEGAQRTFALQPDGSYHAPPGVADTLAVSSGAHVLTQADGSALRYDGDGRLVALFSDDGIETTVGYDQYGRLATVTAPGGRWVEVTIAATPHGDRVTRVEAADGRAVAYGYDGDGRLQTVTDVRGEVWTYRYDGAGRLDRVTDPLGAHVHTTTYDAEGRVVEQVDARGGVTTFAWGLDGGTGWVTMTDAAGGEHTDFYLGHVLVARYDAAGRGTAYHYDDELRLVRLDQPDGSTVTLEHDQQGRLTHTHTQPAWSLDEPEDPGLAAAVSTVVAPLDGQTFGVALETDAQHAWVGLTGALVRVDLDTGTVAATADASEHAWRATDSLHSLVLVGDIVYVAAGRHAASGNGVRSKVIAYDLAAGTSQVVADLGPDTRSQIGAVTAAPDGSVFFTRQWGEPAVYRLTPGVGDGYELVHAFSDGSPGGIAAGADWLYVHSTAGGGSVVRMDHAGGEASTLVDGLVWHAVEEPSATSSWRQTRALALAGEHLYTVAAGGFALARVPLEGGEAQHVAGSQMAGEAEGTYAQARFDRLHGIAVADELLVASDRENRRLALVVDPGIVVEPPTEPPVPPAVLTAASEYDGDGNVVATVDAAGRETTYAYDAAGRVTSVTGPDGVTTSTTYDDRGLPTAWDTGGLVTTATYDPVTGDLLSVTEPDGATTTWTYDPAGRVLETVPAAGNVAGADPQEHTTSFTYDAAGQLLAATDPLGRTVANDYDAAGRLAATTDPAGRVTSFSYDEAGNLVGIQGPDLAAGPVTTTYDALGRRAGTTDATGRTSSWVYDMAGNVVEVADASGTATLAYDPAGRLVASTDQAGRATSFAHDAHGHLAEVVYADGAQVGFTYDAAGLLVERVDATGVTSFAYDADDRPVEVTTPDGLFTYSWDALGRLESRSTPDGGVDGWVYDAAGRLVETRLDGQQVAAYGYDDAGRLVEAALASGVVETVELDVAGRVAAVEARDAAGGLVQRSAYHYDVLDRPIRVIDAHDQRAFVYDDADRLVRACQGVPACDGSESEWIAWEYGQAGDRLVEERPGVARTYAYDAAGRLLEVEVDEGSGPEREGAFAYDGVGNVVGAGESVFGWDAAGRLVSASVDGATVAYGYDGRGLRVSASDGQVSRGWVWDPLSGELVASTSDDGTQTSLSRVLPGGHGLAVDGQVWWRHRDAAGSVRAVSDAAGGLAWSLDYEPFGVLAGVRDGAGVPVGDPAGWPVELAGFHGLAHEPSGLVYAGARWLDPALGRFVSADAAGGGYGYAFANPVVFADPSGLWAESRFSGYVRTAAVVGGWVAIGTVAAALVVGAPLSAPLIAGTLLASGAVGLAADAVHVSAVCRAGKGGCGAAVAMAGIMAAGGRYLRPLRAAGRTSGPPPARTAPQRVPRSPDFVAGPPGGQPPVPVSQSRMAAGLDSAGFPRTPTSSPGMEYVLPDGSRVRLMAPSGQAPRRASFTNAQGGPINPFTGKTVQPPPPPGWTMKDWVREFTHIRQTP